MDQASATTEIVQTSTGFLPMFIMLFVCAGLSAVIWLLATYLGPNRPNKRKNSPYECGIVPEEDVHQRLDIHFYRVGILFLIFGVEVVFFFPWALAMTHSADRMARIISIVDMGIFAVILIAGFVYAWAKGGLTWSLERTIQGKKKSKK